MTVIFTTRVSQQMCTRLERIARRSSGTYRDNNDVISGPELTVWPICHVDSSTLIYVHSIKGGESVKFQWDHFFSFITFQGAYHVRMSDQGIKHFSTSS